MFNIIEITKGNIVAFEVTGKIHKEDYEKLNPLLEKTERKYDKINLFILLTDLEGITLSALLEDIKTYFRHIRKVKKVAIVGRNGIDKGLSNITNVFISAEVKYFSKREYELAKVWIME
jgi:hypothetical protein